MEKSTLVYANLIPQAEYKITESFGISSGGFFKLLLRNSYYDYAAKESVPSQLNDYARYDAGLAMGIHYYRNNKTLSLNYHHGLWQVSTASYFSENYIFEKEQYNRILQLTGSIKIF